MSFVQSWHPRKIAECWPSGSVVLVRVKQGRPLFHGYTYFLSNHFTVLAMSNDPAHEYMLIEEPKQKETNETIQNDG